MAFKVKAEYTKRYDKLRAVSSRVYDESSDCTVIATALAARISYGKAHAMLAKRGRLNGEGFNMPSTIDAILEASGKDFHRRLGGYPVRTIKTAGQRMPEGEFLLVTRNHVAYMIDGIVHDHRRNATDRVVEVYALVEA